MMASYRQRGFTLIEVMVALVIISLSLGAVAAAISQMADAGNSMRLRTYASWIAQNKIAELRLANVVPEVTETNGDVMFANQEWLWTATVSETGVENLFRVDVEVALASNAAPIRTVTGFIGEPVQPGVGNRAWSGAALEGDGPEDAGDGEQTPESPGDDL
ncbi:MAG: type II secretion system minor pseudopilin GspI [Woeseia sp.]